jgi:hypothetical protein
MFKKWLSLDANFVALLSNNPYYRSILNAHAVGYLSWLQHLA